MIIRLFKDFFAMIKEARDDDKKMEECFQMLREIRSRMDQVCLYRAKPVEARQLTIDNIGEIAKWVNGDLHIDSESCQLGYINKLGLYDSHASYGDWIVKDNDGFITYSAKDFQKKYEELK